jgi:hypothetical protein
MYKSATAQTHGPTPCVQAALDTIRHGNEMVIKEAATNQQIFRQNSTYLEFWSDFDTIPGDWNTGTIERRADVVEAVC